MKSLDKYCNIDLLYIVFMQRPLDRVHLCLQDIVNMMDTTSLRNFVIEEALLHPVTLLHLTQRGTLAMPPHQGFHPQANTPTPHWCVCGHCRDMPTDVERKCCGQLPQVCLSVFPQMDQVIMHTWSIELNTRYRADLLAEPNDLGEDVRAINKYYRHGSYRNFILWVFGYLGEGVRVVIPSCCVWRIRDKFPDPYGQYTGFKASRFA